MSASPPWSAAVAGVPAPAAAPAAAAAPLSAHNTVTSHKSGAELPGRDSSGPDSRRTGEPRGS